MPNSVLTPLMLAFTSGIAYYFYILLKVGTYEKSTHSSIHCAIYLDYS
jgi:hypothetical protein